MKNWDFNMEGKLVPLKGDFMWEKNKGGYYKYLVSKGLLTVWPPKWAWLIQRFTVNFINGKPVNFWVACEYTSDGSLRKKNIMSPERTLKDLIKAIDVKVRKRKATRKKTGSGRRGMIRDRQ